MHKGLDEQAFLPSLREYVGLELIISFERPIHSRISS